MSLASDSPPSSSPSKRSASLLTSFFAVLILLFLLSPLSSAQECPSSVGAEVTCQVPSGTADLSVVSVDTRSFNGITYGSFRTSQSEVKTLFPWSSLPGSVRLTGVVTPFDSRVPHIFTADLTKNGADMMTPYLFCSPSVLKTSDGTAAAGDFRNNNAVTFPIGNTTVTCTMDFNYPIAYSDTLSLSRSTPSNSELSTCYDNSCQPHQLGSQWAEPGGSVYYVCTTLVSPFAYGKVAGCNASGSFIPDLTTTTIAGSTYFCNVSSNPQFFIITKPTECNVSLPFTDNSVNYDCVVVNNQYQYGPVGCTSPESVVFAPNEIKVINGVGYFCNTAIPALVQLNSTYCQAMNQTFTVTGSLVIDNIIYKCFGQGQGDLVTKSTGCQDQFGTILKAGQVSEDSVTSSINVCGYDNVNQQYFYAPLSCVDCSISGQNVPIEKVTVVGSDVYTCFVSYSGQVSTQLVGTLSPCLGY